jgi:hypothetical protein
LKHKSDRAVIQEDGEQAKLSVFHLFCELFPEVAALSGDAMTLFIELLLNVTASTCFHL